MRTLATASEPAPPLWDAAERPTWTVESAALLINVRNMVCEDQWG